MRRIKSGTHHEPYWDLIKWIITESDLVLEILDSRLVELSRNEKVEELIKEIGRPVIFVINKSDLVSKDNIKKQIQELGKNKDGKNKEVVFISCKNPRTIKILLYVIKKVFKKYGKREIIEKNKFDKKQKYREAKADIVVSVLGYPNVGKSSIINSLCHRKKTKVSKKSGTTHGLQWVRATDEIKLIDSPGVIPLQRDDEIRYGLIGAKDSEALKNPELVAHAIIKLFLKKNKKQFERFYNIEIEKTDPESIISQIGEKRGYLLKKGKIDENRVMVQIVRDWQQGKLRLDY